MTIPESDLAYERAGQDEAVCEELLADLQKKRADGLKGIAKFLGAILISGALAFLLLLYPVFTPQSPHPVMDWFFAHFQMFAFGVGAVFFLLIPGYLLTVLYYDHRIKMLLLLRGKRKTLP